MTRKTPLAIALVATAALAACNVQPLYTTIEPQSTADTPADERMRNFSLCVARSTAPLQDDVEQPETFNNVGQYVLDGAEGVRYTEHFFGSRGKTMLGFENIDGNITLTAITPGFDSRTGWSDADPESLIRGYWPAAIGCGDRHNVRIAGPGQLRGAEAFQNS
ncbi:MAG: hypothetical protein AB7G06_08280 [Bdellovibrionales bacterium]